MKPSRLPVCRRRRLRCWLRADSSRDCVGVRDRASTGDIELPRPRTEQRGGWSKSPLVARPAHQPDRRNSGNHGSVLNQLEAVVCSWDLLSAQVPRLGPLSIGQLRTASWFIVLCDTNSFRADLGESLRPRPSQTVASHDQVSIVSLVITRIRRHSRAAPQMKG